jgi:hypothetical protein
MFLERLTKNNSGGWGLYVLFDSGNTKLKAKVNNDINLTITTVADVRMGASPLTTPPATTTTLDPHTYV